MITVCKQVASTLFDIGSTFFYVFVYYVALLGVTPKPYSSLIQVSTLVVDSLMVDRVYRGYMITLQCFGTWVGLIL